MERGITFFPIDSLISFIEDMAMDYLVEPAAKYFTDKVWNFVRDQLMIYGIEKVLSVLDRLFSFIINKILTFVLKKIASAAYNLCVKNLKTICFSKNKMHHQPEKVIVV